MKGNGLCCCWRAAGTFDFRIEATDPKAVYEIGRVRLAEVGSPTMSTPEEPRTLPHPAPEFSTTATGEDHNKA